MENSKRGYALEQAKQNGHGGHDVDSAFCFARISGQMVRVQFEVSNLHQEGLASNVPIHGTEYKGISFQLYLSVSDDCLIIVLDLFTQSLAILFAFSAFSNSDKAEHA